MSEDAALIAQLTRERLARRTDDPSVETAAPPPPPAAPSVADVARIAKQTGLTPAEVRRLSAST